MIAGIVQTSKSLTIPVPKLIVFRFFSPTAVSDYLPSFSWLPFEGASKYILKLKSSKQIIWLKEVPATSETTVTYDGVTLLQPGENYIFTVESDFRESYLNFQIEQEDKIAQFVKKGINKIKEIDLPKQFKASIMAQLDGLLIAREEILDIIGKARRQGSDSEIICFLNNFLHQASAFESLANAFDSDDILDGLAEIANQLAAANLTLSEYLQLSGIQKSLAGSLVSKGTELAFFSQKLQGGFQLGQFSGLTVLSDCAKCEANIKAYCRSNDCVGCRVCTGFNPT